MVDFIIIGAQKAGTTAAAHNLNLHPDISMFSGITEYGQHEIEFFNQHWDKGVQWYHNQLPATKGLKGEKTAELLHRIICHERIFTVSPKAKIIVLLRCPIERAYSQWRMAFFNKKDENRTFDDIVLEESKKLNDYMYKTRFHSCSEKTISCWREGYILKGFYCEQLKNLYRFFPTENVHIAITERVKGNKDMEYNRMFSFLNLRPFFGSFEERFVGEQSDKIKPRTYNLLKEIYFKPNYELFNMLGFEIKEWLCQNES